MSIQQLIIKGIKEQLFVHNYLVLPGFGGFVLKFNSSHFSNAGTSLLPPSKTVSFNAQLKQNDGLLVLWLQKQLKCDTDEALTHLNEFSGFCSSILTTRRRLSLDGIGFFYLDFENNICFEPQQDTNFLTKSFGLGPISIKEVEPEIIEKKKETIFVDRTVREDKTILVPKQKRNYSRMIVPAALVLLFLSGLLLFVSTAKINGQLNASLFSSSKKLLYTPLNYTPLILQNVIEKDEAYVTDANGIAVLNLDNTKTIAVKVIFNSINKPVTSTSKSIKLFESIHGKFEIVLGCFTVLENANRMLVKLEKQQVSAFVSGKNEKGMYVVSNGAFETRLDALNQLDKIKGVYPKAWIKQD